MEESFAKAYKEAGVDVTAGYEAVKRMKPDVESTYIPGVIGTLGGFGGLFEPDFSGMEEPVLVSGTDGVGTKLKLAFLLDKHDTVGVDCVAMCVNDIICSGATPLIFLDYIACGKNSPERIASIVSGIAEGCRQAGCALIGGETAEMPGFYPPDEYDLAGFSVGMADKAKLIDSGELSEGDKLIGLASSGPHSNGFSLIRKVFDLEREDLKSPREELGGRSLGEALLEPTRIYVPAMKALVSGGITPKAVSHITGGGFHENVPRMLRDGLTARIELDSFPTPPIFDLIKKRGDLTDGDLYNTFNMGIGMVLAVAPEQVQKSLELLKEAGEEAYLIGDVVKGEKGVELV